MSGVRAGHWNIILLFLGMYLFVWSLSGLKHAWGMAFAVDGKEGLAKSYISRMTGNPLSGLCLGIIATALVQSSSGVVAVTIATVAAGGMTVTQAVPLIMGANIGTTVTCVIVTLGYAMRKREFSKAVPVALLNDVVKTLSVFFFFIIEYNTGFLSSLAVRLAGLMAGLPVLNYFLGGFPDFLDIVVDPVLVPVEHVVSGLLSSSSHAALAMGVLSFMVLILGLEVMGNAAESALKGKASRYVHLAFKTKGRGLVIGTSFASILQSSSVATSLAIPFAASGRISLRETYPYLLGCNIGTTIDPGQIASYLKFGVMGLQVGLVHVLLNVFSVLLWFGVPRLSGIPLVITERISAFILSSRNATLSLVVYTLLLFFIIPLIVVYVT
ncbi:MAG: Na/Pi symporter [Candidatus Altiarchaeota archaeon]